MTELDTHLRELALTDWPRFVEMIGPKALNKAKICLLKKQNRTLRYISYRTKLARSTVQQHCKKCDTK